MKCGCKLEPFLEFKGIKAPAAEPRSGFKIIDGFKANLGRVIAVDTAALPV